MELDVLKTMWLANDVKIEQSVKLNEERIELAKRQKVVSKLTPLYWQRVIECIFHSIVIVLLVGFITMNSTEFPYLVSAIALLAFYVTTFVNAFRQVRLINTMDIGSNLADMQSSLIRLQTHIVNYAKLAVLFIPTFFTYPVIITKVIKDFNIKAMAEFDIIEKSGGNWWTLELVGLFILVPLGIWFYIEVSDKNIHKSWVRNFIEKSSGKRVVKALEFLNELQGLKEK